MTTLPPSPPPPVASRARTAAAVAVTGEDGRARWTYPVPFTRPPVLTALPVDPAPEDDERTVTVALEEVTPTYAVVRASWRCDAVGSCLEVDPTTGEDFQELVRRYLVLVQRAHGIRLAGEGVVVHLTAQETSVNGAGSEAK